MCLILPCFPGLAAPLPDPTRPADYAPSRPVDSAAAEEMEWKVNGITISPRGNSAIINGQVVTAGDQVASATVFEILPTGVVLDVRGSPRDGRVSTANRQIGDLTKRQSKAASNGAAFEQDQETACSRSRLRSRLTRVGQWPRAKALWTSWTRLSLRRSASTPSKPALPESVAEALLPSMDLYTVPAPVLDDEQRFDVAVNQVPARQFFMSW